MTLIEDMLTEQIASLQASAAVHVRQRADALAAAEAAAVHAAGANARAAELQAALDDYRAALELPIPPAIDPDPAP